MPLLNSDSMDYVSMNYDVDVVGNLGVGHALGHWS